MNMQQTPTFSKSLASLRDAVSKVKKLQMRNENALETNLDRSLQMNDMLDALIGGACTKMAATPAFVVPSTMDKFVTGILDGAL